MLRLTVGLCATVATVLIASACGSESPVPAEEVVERADEIVGGSPDTTNQAVVFVQGNGGACTATIIAKNGSTGYALTAAHCTGGGGPSELRIGNNLTNPTSVHQIVQVSVHPSYDGSPNFDFALLRFTGANAGTPVIPAASPADDNLTIGSQIEHSGYGNYNSGNQLLQSNIRRHAFGQVDGLNSQLLDYDQSWGGNPGGPCNGDSGGPQLAGGRVVGVTSQGDQLCQQYGVSGRVSNVYNSFIAPFIGGQPGPATCDECAAAAQNPGGACAGAVDACAANPQCADLVGCINNCSTEACIQNCANTYPNGVATYNALIGCICDVGCVTECASLCGGSSSSTTGSGPGGVTSVTTGAGAGPGVGGGAVTGAGGAGIGTGTETGAGAGSAKSNDDDDDDKKKSSGCAVSAPGDAGSAPIPAWFMAAALLGLGAMARRSRSLPSAGGRRSVS